MVVMKFFNVSVTIIALSIKCSQFNNCVWFVYAALEVYFINDTPVLTVDRLFAEFRASRPNVTLECHLTHLDFTREDCKFLRITIAQCLVNFSIHIPVCGPA